MPLFGQVKGLCHVLEAVLFWSVLLLLGPYLLREAL